jgi:hypothetical protein
MYFTNVTRRIGRALVAGVFAVAAISLISPETAHARRGNNGAAIALGVVGGVLAGAAIASAAQGYYAPPPAYYYPYAPQAYSAAPAYSYAPPAAAYYAPAPYYGPRYNYGGY